MNDLNTSTEARITDETAIGFIPCYRLPFLSLYQIDVLEGLKNIPDKSQDLINVYLVELFGNYNLLDLSFITESTHLKNKSFFNVKNITQNFPFQIDFEEYAFNWLNKKRLLNNKNNLSKKEFVDKKIVDAFRPTSEYWFIDGLGSEALVDYIQEKKYDAVLFKRELAILNTNIIKDIKLKE